MNGFSENGHSTTSKEKPKIDVKVILKIIEKDMERKMSP